VRCGAGWVVQGPLGSVCQHGWNADTKRDARRNSQAQETSDWQGSKDEKRRGERRCVVEGGWQVVKVIRIQERRRGVLGSGGKRKATGGLAVFGASRRGIAPQSTPLMRFIFGAASNENHRGHHPAPPARRGRYSAVTVHALPLLLGHATVHTCTHATRCCLFRFVGHLYRWNRRLCLFVCW
jgi:hypothetical protein